MKTLREKIEGQQRWDVLTGVTGRGFMGHTVNGGFLEREAVRHIIAEHEKDDPLPKIAALFNGWANAGAPDGGPANVTTAAGVLAKIGAALGDPLELGDAEQDPEELHKQNYGIIGQEIAASQRRAANLRLAAAGAHPLPVPGGQEADEEFRAGLPAGALRKAWQDWTQVDSESNARADLRFKGEVYRFAWWADWMPDRRIDSCAAWDREKLRPRGKTWAEVEAMAKAAEVPNCHAGQDGECNWQHCPQNRDGEPATSGRSCPLWNTETDES